MLSRSNTWFRGAHAEKKGTATAGSANPPYPIDEDDRVELSAETSALAAPARVEDDIDPNDACTDVLHLSQASDILSERLQAWKHAVGYLEDYIGATEKVHKAHAKEYEKVLKVCYGSKNLKSSIC